MVVSIFYMNRRVQIMRDFFLVFLISIIFFACTPIEQEGGIINPSITGGQQHLQQPFPGLAEPPLQEPTHMPLPYPVPEVIEAQQQGAASFNLLNYTPNQLIACTRKSDLVTIALYFYEPDQDNMTCSFLSYSKEYKNTPAGPAETVTTASTSPQQETASQASEKVAKYIESNSHIRGADYDDCLKRAQEAYDTKRRTNWECSETQLPGKIQL